MGLVTKIRPKLPLALLGPFEVPVLVAGAKVLQLVLPDSIEWRVIHAAVNWTGNGWRFDEIKAVCVKGRA